MHPTVAITAALLTLFPTSLAVGTAHVVNNCGAQVYFASVGQSAHSDMAALPASGYSEGFDKSGVGISIKLSPSASGPVTQFEFTWVEGQNVAYDISNIDGNPFSAGGMSLVPSMEGAEGFPSCVTVNCPAGQDRCDAAYNLPDDVRTKVCPENSDLTFTLCPGGAPAAGGEDSGSVGVGLSAAAGNPAQLPQAASEVSTPAQGSLASSVKASSTNKSTKPTGFRVGHPPQRRAHAPEMV